MSRVGPNILHVSRAHNNSYFQETACISMRARFLAQSKPLCQDFQTQILSESRIS